LPLQLQLQLQLQFSCSAIAVAVAVACSTAVILSEAKDPCIGSRSCSFLAAILILSEAKVAAPTHLPTSHSAKPALSTDIKALNQHLLYPHLGQ